MEGSGFLPPEPPGPEPELGGKPSAPRPEPPGPAAPGGGLPAPGEGQPPGAGWQPPGQGHPSPPGQAYPPPGQAYPPPGQGYPPPPGQAYPPPPGQGYPPPPGHGYPPYGQQWGYPQQAAPDNGPAVAGFVLSLVSAGLLLISGGLSSLVSVGCAVAGMVYSRKGKQKVAAGETPKHGGLAKAGWIIGTVALVLSLLATAGWILVAVLAATDEQFRDDLEQELDDSQTITATLRIALAVLRLIA